MPGNDGKFKPEHGDIGFETVIASATIQLSLQQWIASLRSQ
jgi:hypothetical protein